MCMIFRVATAVICAVLCGSPPSKFVYIRVIDDDTLPIREHCIRLMGFGVPKGQKVDG